MKRSTTKMYEINREAFVWRADDQHQTNDPRRWSKFEAKKYSEENSGGQSWQDVPDVGCAGSSDVAMAKLVESMLKHDQEVEGQQTWLFAGEESENENNIESWSGKTRTGEQFDSQRHGKW